MMNLRIPEKSARAGFSRIRLLIVLLVLILLGLAVGLKIRNDALESVRQAQLARMQEVKDALRADAQKLLQETTSSIEGEDLEAAKISLRKAKIMDVEVEFSSEIATLLGKIRMLEVKLLVDAQAAELELAIAQSIKEQRFDDAIVHIDQLKQLSGHEEKATEALQKLDQQKRQIQNRKAISERIQKELNGWNIAGAESGLMLLEKMTDAESEVLSARLRISERKKLDDAALAEVQELLLLDRGVFSAAVLDRLDVALMRAPGHPKLLEVQKKFLAYPQRVKVPSEFATIDEAYAQLREGGVIEIGEGVFYVELNIDKGISLQGSGEDKTVLESRTRSGAALHFSAGRSVVSSLSVRGFRDEGGVRALVRVSGGELQMNGCVVSRSASHGIAVSAGQLQMVDTKITNNLMNGVALTGAQSSLVAECCHFLANADHGVDVWGGAKVQMKQSVSKENAKAGLVVSGEATVAVLENVSLVGNREVGASFTQSATVQSKGLASYKNHFSGILIQAIARAQFEGVNASNNGEYGFIIDRESKAVVLGELHGEGNTLGRILQKRLK